MTNPKFEFFKSTIIGKKIAVLGLGVSNMPLIKMLSEIGAVVTGCDKKEEKEFDMASLDILRKYTKNLYLGDEYLNHLNDQDIIFKTPGIRPDIPALKKARENGVLITSEMEVFFSVCPCTIIAVTGSDGKTTTTTLISEILKKSGKNVYLGGNIGTPLLDKASNMKSDDFAVVELSSFQLQTMDQSGDIAVITNIVPNHLDYHKDMDEYINSKKNIFLNQIKSNKLIVNMENDITNSFENEANGNVVKFSLHKKVTEGAYVLDNKIYFGDEFIMNTTDIRLPGIHNVDNFLAAICATYGLCTKDDIVYVAKHFGGVKHRLEFVRELDGIKFYNDSIASSPTRTTAGLKSFDQKVILIAGGYDKKIPFDGFGEIIREKVKTLILVGATSEKIYEEVEKTFKKYGEKLIPAVKADSFEYAVKSAKAVAEKGDIVLLSPACASFDMFKNFEVRGDKFKDIVLKL